MAAELDALIRKGKAIETQIEQLTVELAALRDEIAARMGAQREYYGAGVVARKWARVRWEIHKELLLDELPREVLEHFKDVVFTKAKLEQALKAGYLPPRLYDRAVKRVQEGWNVSLKLLEASESEPE
jgi:ParB-like chromosome segregation protein Spo0J